MTKIRTNTTKPIVIGIAGGTGSGKTTVANAIFNALNSSDILMILHDSYYRDRSDIPLSEREKINFDHPDALETSLLIEHLKALIKGNRVNVPIYDFKTHTRKEGYNCLAPAGTIIIEGILIFCEQALRDLMDVKIFVGTDDDIRFIRRLQRDITERGRSIESVISQYMKTVRPMHLDFVEPSKKYADIIIPEGHNPVAINMVVSMINDKANSR